MKGMRNTEILITGGTLEIGQGIAVSTAVEGSRLAIKHLKHIDDAETGALSHHASVHSVHQVAVR